MEPVYACKECGVSVEVKDGTIVRGCGHDDAPVTASVEAKCKGKGKLSHATPGEPEGDLGGEVPLAVRANIANALIALAQKVLAGEFNGLQVDWQGGPLCKVSARPVEGSKAVAFTPDC